MVRILTIVCLLALLMIAYYNIDLSPPRAVPEGPSLESVSPVAVEDEPAVSPVPADTEQLLHEVIVIAADVNVRSGPTTNEPVVGSAQLNQRLVILETVPEWSRVRLPSGIEGWIAARYTSVVAPEDAAVSDIPPDVTTHDPIEFSLVSEEVEDMPIKTQVVQHVIVSGFPSAEQVEFELAERFDHISQRSGFEYHENPTNIYIYIYETAEQAAAGQGLWIGMLEMRQGAEFSTIINTERLAAMSAAPVERFGLSEDERRQIFFDLAAAEVRAREEAMSQIPDSRIHEQLELERSLRDRYTQQLLDHWKLTEGELGPIKVEAYEGGWVAP